MSYLIGAVLGIAVAVAAQFALTDAQRNAFFIVWDSVGIAYGLATGTTWLVVVCGVGLAIELWRWWHRRGRRVADRVTGVVRDLGHRLSVVNVPAPGGAR